MLDAIEGWVHQSQTFGWTLAAALGGLLLSLVAGLVVIFFLPADYFVRAADRPGFLPRHPIVRVLLLVAKNTLGGLVFLAGFIMALPLVPGPGVLFMLLGIGICDFPGKRSLERRLFRVPRVLASINRLRARLGRGELLSGAKPPRSVVDSAP
jgi:hypothetical protein